MDCYNKLEHISKQIITTLNTVKIPQNGVVVYDVDHTLLDSQERPINPIIQTYLHANNLGLYTVIITARIGTQENIQRTINILNHYGIGNQLCMYFRPPDRYDLNRFKTMARKNLHDRGYNVVMSIGDMPWDIGEYGGIGFRLPQC